MPSSKKRVRSADAYVDRHRNPQTNIRFSEEERVMADTLAAHHGISLRALLVMLVRRAAREQGLIRHSAK